MATVFLTVLLYSSRVISLQQWIDCAQLVCDRTFSRGLRLCSSSLFICNSASYCACFSIRTSSLFNGNSVIHYALLVPCSIHLFLGWQWSMASFLFAARDSLCGPELTFHKPWRFLVQVCELFKHRLFLGVPVCDSTLFCSWLTSLISRGSLSSRSALSSFSFQLELSCALPCNIIPCAYATL